MPADQATSFKEIENKYLSEVYKPKAKICRVFYFFCFLCALAFCLYIITLLLISYFKHDSYNVIQVRKVTEIRLPALTICNVNTLDAKKMEKKKLGRGGFTMKDLFYNFTNNFKQLESGDDDDSEMDEIGDLYDTYAMDLKGMVFDALFAKENIFNKSDPKSFGNMTFTELGKCLELNDDQKFVQQIEGAIGGLTLYLDAKIDHYLATTSSYGFVIFLRMPYEAVLNKEFGFFVAPGRETFVRLEKEKVSRLKKPYGQCSEMENLFESGNKRRKATLSSKECFMLQTLHGYLHDSRCACWPWYYYKRFLTDKDSSHFNPGAAENVAGYFSSLTDKNMAISFNGSCKQDVEEDLISYTRGEIKPTHTNVTNVAACAAKCRNNPACRVYLYSSESNDILREGECKLFSGSVVAKELRNGTNVAGLSRGQVNCTQNIGQCSPLTYAKCENYVILKRMGNKQPPPCHEPCNFTRYTPHISTTAYPSFAHWQHALQNTTYSDYGEARLNLAKVNIFFESLMIKHVTQTKSYEIQNFIAQFGGITDLLIGISFFTVFQFIEVAFGKICGYFKKGD